MQKLTEPEVRQIKRTLALHRILFGDRRRPPGMRQRLAAKHGVSVACIKRIIEERSWRHVRVNMHWAKRAHQ